MPHQLTTTKFKQFKSKILKRESQIHLQHKINQQNPQTFFFSIGKFHAHEMSPDSTTIPSNLLSQRNEVP